MRTIAVDVGNSDVVLGVWNDDQWEYIWRVPRLKGANSEIYYAKNWQNQMMEQEIPLNSIGSISVSSVVPDINPNIKLALIGTFKISPKWIDPQAISGMKLEIDNPSEIGSDLVSNAYAAASIYKDDCIVVDFGTALSVTVVSKDYHVKGVAIAPGLKTAMKALHGNTAQLPEVPLSLPASAIGKNTTHAIQAGVLWGYVGLVKEIVHRMKGELGDSYKVIATGGLSKILGPLEQIFDDIDPQLTLNGIRLLGDLIEKEN